MTEWWNDMHAFQHSDETTELLEEETNQLLTQYKKTLLVGKLHINVGAKERPS
jgi:hypothetical protein